MKKLLPILCFMIPIICISQQHPSYTQYEFNKFAINPATAGLAPCLESTLGSRKEWQGFDGAPLNFFASLNGRLRENHHNPRNYHGIGGIIITEKIAFTTLTYAKLAYAYHLKLQRNFHLSFGVFGGIQVWKYSKSDIIVQNIALDPALNSDETRSILYPEVSPGVYLYNNKLFAGFSILQGFPAGTKDLGTKKNRMSPHIFQTFGYKFKGREIYFQPSYLLAIAPFASPTFDMTATIGMDNVFAFAIGSKYLNSTYVSLNIQLFNNFSFGYAYEYALNEIEKVAPSSHELILKFNTCKKEDKHLGKVYCPTYH